MEKYSVPAMFKHILRIGVVCGLLHCIASHAQSLGVSPHDCAEIKYITGLWMNTRGTQVAYLVKSPNVDKNLNEYQLYTKDPSDPSLSPGKLLMTGIEMSDIQWYDDDRRIALLASISGRSQIVSVNIETSLNEVAFPTEENIDSFSIDAAGETITYSVPDHAAGSVGLEKFTKEQLAEGYRIFEEPNDVNDGFLTKSVYLRHRFAKGAWSVPESVAIENPFTRVKTTHLAGARNISLSPNGKQIILMYNTDGVPDSWSTNPFVHMVKQSLTMLAVPVLYDVQSRKSTLAFQMIEMYNKPAWSADSRFYFLNAHSPIGSSWEANDIRDGLISAADVNMFRVNTETGAVEQVFRHIPPIAYHYGPMYLSPNGDVVVRAAGTAVARLHNVAGEWKQQNRISLPNRAEDRFEILASNGEQILGVHETVTSPENLFGYRPGQSQLQMLTNLNPHFETLHAASVETVHWKTAEGLNITGLLFMPPDYVPGNRYPLVIQTKANSGWFACDSGAQHDPSFAPQPIASHGMMYLARSYDETWDMQEEVKGRPKGYPGGISEAVQQVDIWDSAVASLDGKGLIDPHKVGIIGFSRTGWYVEFALVHSHVRYAAATATDNVQYSLSDYWLIPGLQYASEQMYGGPPYGATLDNWKKYSISFNLDKIHAPLLLEEMGYNVLYDNSLFAAPTTLAVRYEITKGLSALGKPVELYYYPNEGHQMDHPRARMVSMQRNLDWYRFWLQGFEDADPSKKAQYERWNKLRRLQVRDSELRPPPTSSVKRVVVEHGLR